MTGRSLRRATAIALALAMAVPGVVAAAWTETTVTENTRFDEPSLALDAGDHAHVAYIGYGDAPGIYVASDADGALDVDAADERRGRRPGDRGRCRRPPPHRLRPIRRRPRHPVRDRHGRRLDGHAVDRASGPIRPRSRWTRPATSTSRSTAIRSNRGSCRSTTRAARGSGPGSRPRTSTARHRSSSMPDGTAKIAFARYAPEAPGDLRRRSVGRPGGPWTHGPSHQRLRRRAHDGGPVGGRGRCRVRPVRGRRAGPLPRDRDPGTGP